MLCAKLLNILLIVSSILGCFAIAGPADEQPLVRQKRTLLLKKKILGAGAIGLGLGIGIGALKGYKYGYAQAPATTLVERPVYIEKPYYVDRPSIHYPNYGNYYTHTNGWASAGGGSLSGADLSSYYSGGHGYYYR